ncbi:SsrA-binding protein SmpB [Lactobacillus acetotolerans]|uniref:SsrA-binding protein n=1 Tax=Lactobacillus acetotolerans TaxID=1600 RepID=A0A5P5ZI32_9LACO|nr:SsrA-binding protein SmpB [Lactobacillus acetotolerans]KRN38423.1 SsrA-binding protein [Lactobacillus acetotolerans DSM 20749 = JCM 3825]QFG50970.1 SsrA-binding protein SmpB [Lactobacillus acetotolerans]QGV04922.1 SsrA-binding protein SmpB [Lactobacillus acetotolerans]QJD73846.1 SsrA-binding protein SmpB [Lactobacillus acetotolerans]GGV17287.1 SsrA-binding protein [Lactobacillus acetotolerans DSM 20749 = JCM 3825]
MKRKNENLVVQNKKARHDYFIKETLEAGIALTGTEIKSVRARRINLRDGYVQIINGSAFLENVHISEYKEGNRYNHEPLRSRRLLLHKKEIRRLTKAQAERGIAIIPLKVYIKHGFAKVLIGVGQGKKQYDKRRTIKKRDQERELRRKYKV